MDKSRLQSTGTHLSSMRAAKAFRRSAGTKCDCRVISTGWSGRDRTSEWRNQNPFDFPRISARIWKKGQNRPLAISIGWQLFPNKEATLAGGSVPQNLRQRAAQVPTAKRHSSRGVFLCPNSVGPEQMLLWYDRPLRAVWPFTDY